MLIHAIEELTVGQDDVIARELRVRREGFAVSIDVAAWTTGAEPEELRALEAGHMHAFPDVERLRFVLMSYCDYLGLDPSPLVARLEAYSRRGISMPPNLHALTTFSPERTIAGVAFSALVFAACLLLPLYFVWLLVRM